MGGNQTILKTQILAALVFVAFISTNLKDAWDPFYSDKEADYLLISVTPEMLEVVDYSRGIVGDPANWLPPSVEF